MPVRSFCCLLLPYNAVAITRVDLELELLRGGERALAALLERRHSVASLRAALRARGLAQSGRKAVLAARLAQGIAGGRRQLGNAAAAYTCGFLGSGSHRRPGVVARRLGSRLQIPMVIMSTRSVHY